jgi:hypothetical protein
MAKKTKQNKRHEIVSSGNKTVYIFDEGMTQEEITRCFADKSCHSQSSVASGLVGNERYKIVYVSARPFIKPSGQAPSDS